jgi:L-lactate permease
MIHIELFKKVGSFAENKDIARDLRLKKIMPALKKNENIILDFENIEGATQSFIHALISDAIRKYGSEVLDKISFKSCNDIIQKIITIVIDYMQESDS